MNTAKYTFRIFAGTTCLSTTTRTEGRWIATPLDHELRAEIVRVWREHFQIQSHREPSMSWGAPNTTEIAVDLFVRRYEDVHLFEDYTDPSTLRSLTVEVESDYRACG